MRRCPSKVVPCFRLAIKGRGFSRMLAAVATLLFASNALADFGSNASLISQLSAPSGDLTMNYLGMLFGYVQGILPSSQPSLMGTMFKFFNWGVLTIASSFMFYTIGMSIVNTANEGSFMGERAKGFARTLRGVVGVGLLVPTASGYSLIQVIVFWVVVQGIGLADYAWATTLNYIGTGGAIAAGANPNTLLTPSAQWAGVQASLAVRVFQSEICLDKLRAMVPANQEIRLYLPAGDTKAYFGSQSTANGGQFWGVCGEYQLNYVNSPEFPYAEAAFEALASAMVAPAQAYLDAFESSVQQHPNQTPDLWSIAVSSLIIGAKNYANIIAPAMNASNANLQNQIQNSFTSSKAQGWATAGSYYMNLVDINQQASYGDLSPVTTSFSENSITSSNIPHLTSTQITQLQNVVGIPMNPVTGGDLRTACNVTGSSATLDSCAQYQLSRIKASTEGDTAGAGTGISTGNMAAAGAAAGAAMLVAGGPAGAVSMIIVVSAVGAVIGEWSSALQSSATQDPILTTAKLGDHMISAGIGIWIGSTIAIFLITLAMSVMNSDTGLNSAMTASNLYFYKMVFSIVMSLITNGVVFAVFTPFVPFFVYLFAVLGWIMAVIESVVAGPLVALGVTHPEGHDLLGKAEQSMMLLLSVLLRPICIVIGFVGATLLVKVALRAFNVGFSQILNSMPSRMTSGVGGFFYAWGAMVIYTLVMIRLVYFCYALTTFVPDRVMKWIGLAGGGPSYGGGAEGMIQEMSSGVAGGMQTGLKAAGEASSEMMQGGMMALDAEGKAKVDKDIKAFKEKHDRSPNAWEKMKMRAKHMRPGSFSEGGIYDRFHEVAAKTGIGGNREKFMAREKRHSDESMEKIVEKFGERDTVKRLQNFLKDRKNKDDDDPMRPFEI